jgi:hypothetical protein
MSETSADSWDGLLKNYLKADNLKENAEEFVCIGINVEGKDIELEFERAEEKFVFSLNVTNMVFLKNNGIKAPKEIVGKVLTLKKVLVMNPQTKKEVEGLRIDKIA